MYENDDVVSGFESSMLLIVSLTGDPELTRTMRAVGLCVRNHRDARVRRGAPRPCVVVFDVRRPPEDRIEDVRELRRTHALIGIVVLGRDGPQTDDLACAYLDAGADEFLRAPLHADEIRARLRALLRRLGQPSRSRFGSVPEGVILNGCDSVLEYSGIRIPLTQNEFRLIALLLRNAEKIVPRESLLLGVWGLPPEARTNVLNMCILALRRKLSAAGTGLFIETVRGIGFQLRAGLTFSSA